MIYDAKNLMSNNSLQLNSDKTEILNIGSQHMSNKQILKFLGPLRDRAKPVAKDLGLWFEQSTFWKTHRKASSIEFLSIKEYFQN